MFRTIFYPLLPILPSLLSTTYYYIISYSVCNTCLRVRHFYQNKKDPLQLQNFSFITFWNQTQTSEVYSFVKNGVNKKCLNDSDNHNGVIIHLESNILEWKVKWAIANITTNKANGSDGIPAELYQILKDDVVRSTALNMPADLETQQWPQDCKRSVFIPIPKKCNAKEYSN